MSQPEKGEELQPGLDPKVPGQQGPEEEHQKEHRAQALRALVLARKKKAGLVTQRVTAGPLAEYLPCASPGDVEADRVF